MADLTSPRASLDQHLENLATAHGVPAAVAVLVDGEVVEAAAGIRSLGREIFDTPMAS
jgi:hypothetical protein